MRSRYWRGLQPVVARQRRARWRGLVCSARELVHPDRLGQVRIQVASQLGLQAVDVTCQVGALLQQGGDQCRCSGVASGQGGQPFGQLADATRPVVDHHCLLRPHRPVPPQEAEFQLPAGDAALRVHDLRPVEEAIAGSGLVVVVSGELHLHPPPHHHHQFVVVMAVPGTVPTRLQRQAAGIDELLHQRRHPDISAATQETHRYLEYELGLETADRISGHYWDALPHTPSLCDGGAGGSSSS